MSESKTEVGTSAQSESRFNSDRPIEKSSEDLFGRTPFARSIARSILGWREKDSLIVAIYGQWGSGKSSLKNLIVEELESGAGGPSILHFNPWSWPTTEGISRSFFRELAISVGRVDQSKQSRNLAKRLRLYGAYISTGAHVFFGVSKILPYLLAVAVALGLGGILIDHPLARPITAWMLLAVAAVASITSWLEVFIAKLEGVATERAEISEKTLSELKIELKNDLAKMSRPVLVVMDDIDRLEREHVREVMQLVRQNADFPNIVYLLLFQRATVEELLREPGRGGREYLEKIVQIPFDLPAIEHARLEQVLFKGLDEILESDPKILINFDKRRWGNLYHGVLKEKFQTLRDVYRLLSTLDFYVSIMRGDRAFELNPVDLIGIETMRIFEPELHQAMFRFRYLLTHYSDGVHGRGDELKQEIVRIPESSSEGFRSEATDFIKQIFPNVEWAFGGMGYGSDFAETWFHELRICSESMFPRYFQFSIEQHQISRSELEELFDLSADRKRFLTRAKALNEEGRLRSALRHLDSYKQKIPIKNAKTFLPALLDVGDFAGHRDGGMYDFDSYSHVRRIAYWYLMQEVSTKTRGKLLEKAFEESQAMTVVQSLLYADSERRVKNDDPAKILLEDKTLERLKKEFVRRLDERAASNEDALLGDSNLAGFLFRWRDWGDAGQVNAWVLKCFNDDHQAPKLLRAFIGEGSSHTFGDHVSRKTAKFQIDSFEKFIAREKIGSRAEELKQRDQTDEVIEVLEAVTRALVGDDE